MTKPNVFSLPSRMALDDAHHFFLDVMRYCGKRMTPEQIGGLCDIYNNFKPKGARDAAPQPQPRKDRQMNGITEPTPEDREQAIKGVVGRLRTMLPQEDVAEIIGLLTDAGLNPDGVLEKAFQDLDQAQADLQALNELAEKGGANDMALDAKRAAIFAKRYPHAAKIKISGRGPDDL